MPKRRLGRNKRAGRNFFLKINERAGQIPIKMQKNKRAGGFSYQKQ